MNPIARAIGILTKPKEELEKAASEPASFGSMLPYVLIFGSISAIMGFISSSIIGIKVGMFGTVRTPIVAGVITAVIGVGVTIFTFWFFAFILRALSGSFGGNKDVAGSLKLAAYTATPVWIAGIFGIFSSLGLGILSLVASLGALVYSVLICIWGTTPLLAVPKEKAVGHAIASIAIVVVTFIVFSLIVGVVVGILMLAVGGGAAMRGLGH